MKYCLHLAHVFLIVICSLLQPGNGIPLFQQVKNGISSILRRNSLVEPPIDLVSTSLATPAPDEVRLPSNELDSFGKDEQLGRTLTEIFARTAGQLLTQAGNAALYYFVIKMLLRAAVPMIEAMKRVVSDSHAPIAVPEELSAYTLVNSTFSAAESEIVASMVAPSSIEESWNNIGGMEALKKIFLVEFHPESGLKHKPTSTLLYGPPGCGKTSFLRGLCREIDSPLLQLTPSMVQKKYFGESSQTIATVFRTLSKLKRAVLLVDEIDSLLGSRRSDDQSHDRSVKTEFMQAWDALKRDTKNGNILVFGATNRPQDLDPAVLRRFDRSWLCPLPDASERHAIWTRLLQDVRHAKNFNISRCVQATEGFSGSDIDTLCRVAASAAQASNRPMLSTDVAMAAMHWQPLARSAAQFGKHQAALQRQQSQSQHPSWSPFSSPPADPPRPQQQQQQQQNKGPSEEPNSDDYDNDSDHDDDVDIDVDDDYDDDGLGDNFGLHHDHDQDNKP